MAGQRRRAECELGHDQPGFGQLMRQRLVARGIDAVEPGADDGDARTGTRQPATMRRRVDTERQPADDGEPGIGQRMGKRLGIAHPLRRGIAAADHAEAGLAQQVAPSLAIQHGGRIGDFQQGLRIIRIRQRHQAVARLIEPGQGGVPQRGVGLAQQRVALGGGQMLHQRAAARRQNGLR